MHALRKERYGSLLYRYMNLTVLCLILLDFPNTCSHISAQRWGIWMVEGVIGPEEMRASDDKLREEMQLKLLRMFMYHVYIFSTQFLFYTKQAGAIAHKM